MTKERLMELIEEAVESTSGPFPKEGIPSDAFLPDYLDSVVLSALVVLIEDEWGFEIADEEIEPELFESLDALARFVEQKAAV